MSYAALDVGDVDDGGDIGVGGSVVYLIQRNFPTLPRQAAKANHRADTRSKDMRAFQTLRRTNQ